MNKQICCKEFKEIAHTFDWMKYADGDNKILMPHISLSDGKKVRINYCPVCGTYVRDFEINANELDL